MYEPYSQIFLLNYITFGSDSKKYDIAKWQESILCLFLWPIVVGSFIYLLKILFSKLLQSEFFKNKNIFNSILLVLPL